MATEHFSCNSKEMLSVIRKVTMETIEKRRAEVSDWQPIETAPKDIAVLVTGFSEAGTYFNVCEVATKGYVNDNIWSSTDSCIYNPTHWMPLPNPPKENNEKA